MAGTIEHDPTPVDTSRPAAVVRVYRYDPDADEGEDKYEFLPNIRCSSVNRPAGAHPGSARFRYAFDSDAPEYPTRFDEVWGFDAAGGWVVRTGDRLVVRAYPADAESEGEDFELLFDGFVQFPELSLGPAEESVAMDAAGTPVRLWADPIRTAVFRDASEADDKAANAEVHWPPPRFNPGGEPNASPDGCDVEDGTRHARPAFLDPLVKRTPPVRRKWTLGMAARYLMFTHNRDEEFVRNPDADLVDGVLKAWVPVADDGGGVIDPDDPSTFTAEDIEVTDIDVTGEKWPVALGKLIEPHGFGFAFELEKDGAGDPYWRLDIYRKDVMDPVKDVYLQRPGEALDPARSNVRQLSLTRDGDVANEAFVSTAPKLVEAGFVLAPLFDFTATDAEAGNLHKWVVGDPDFDPVKFRLWGVDETGEGHRPASATSGAWDPLVATATGLSMALDGVADGERKNVVRRRPGRHELLSADPDHPGEKYRARLYISDDYAGAAPGEYDRSDPGKFRQVKSGGWELLDDRLGVRLTAANLTDWAVGQPPPVPAGGAFPSGAVNVVKSTATPETGALAAGRWFCLMLVTAVEADRGVGADPAAEALRREASPLPWAAGAVDEVRDRFLIHQRNPSSPWHSAAFAPPVAGAEPDLIRDDRDDARAHVMARRKAHELAPLSGPVTIPRLSLAYRNGDRVRRIVGRDVELTTNVLDSAQELPVYPCVEAISWSFEGRQETHLTLSDRRADPPPRRRT